MRRGSVALATFMYRSQSDDPRLSEMQVTHQPVPTVGSGYKAFQITTCVLDVLQSGIVHRVYRDYLRAGQHGHGERDHGPERQSSSSSAAFANETTERTNIGVSAPRRSAGAPDINGPSNRCGPRPSTHGIPGTNPGTRGPPLTASRAESASTIRSVPVASCSQPKSSRR